MGTQAIVDNFEHAHLYEVVAALWVADVLLGVFASRRVNPRIDHGSIV